MAIITMTIRLARITIVTIQVIWTRDGEELVNSRWSTIIILFFGIVNILIIYFDFQINFIRHHEHKWEKLNGHQKIQMMTCGKFMMD